jgi:hypothetical protein
MRILAVISFVVAVTPALACMDDTDCDSGARCIKGTGIYGACIGGTGKSHDADPRKELPVEDDAPTPKACGDDTDCGAGSRCMNKICIDR